MRGREKKARGATGPFLCGLGGANQNCLRGSASPLVMLRGKRRKDERHYECVPTLGAHVRPDCCR